ncbi:MAG: cell wall hydrolase [Novosphingobium sp.]
MATLDLGMYRQLTAAGEGWTLRRAAPGIAAAGVLALALLLATRVIGGDGASQRIALDEIRDVSALTVDDKAQIVAEGLDAQAQNAAIPLAGLPLEQVGGVNLAAAAATQATALRCLTQAVYYEAATEPMQGRRAVAQVVLNRMRHPAYPKSVCGVVYQGSERRTGCQFSFTCDGSLLRGPMAGPWREAQGVAAAALAGYVEQSVGTATHYHADYVLPKWAFQLGKIEQLGRHIFYRFTGGWGRAGAFTGKWAGTERIPAINFAALEARLAADGALLPAEEAFTPGLTVTPHVTDRHAERDVGGRIDTTKQWRLTIPDPAAASSRYRAAVGDEAPAPQPKAAESLAVADQPKDAVKP